MNGKSATMMVRVRVEMTTKPRGKDPPPPPKEFLYPLDCGKMAALVEGS